jgi:hypothetical protein
MATDPPDGGVASEVIALHFLQSGKAQQRYLRQRLFAKVSTNAF